MAVSLAGSETIAAYDALANAYDRHWGPVAVRDFMPVVERIVLSQIAPGATVLDACCGTGHLAAWLLDRGYRVMAFDASPAMVARAKRNARGAELLVADIRRFGSRCQCDAALCTFDSLNHLLSLDDLACAMSNVAAALRPGGWFLFDMNTPEAFAGRHGEMFAFVEADEVCVVRVEYQAAGGRGIYNVTLFVNAGPWSRYDLRLVQRSYHNGEVLAAVEEAGFADLHAYDAVTDLGMDGHEGRRVYVCRRHSIGTGGCQP